MKKKVLFTIISTALTLQACSSDEEIIFENQSKSMELNATVANNSKSRAIINNENTNWSFDFSTGDIVKVTNESITDKYYTFTKGDNNFTSSDAEETTTETTWYAYFPSENINLTNQSGNLSTVANNFVLAGKTPTATTGTEGLTINMLAQVAILQINTIKAKTDINIKNGESSWITGLTADKDKFTVTSNNSKSTILSTTTAGTYYIVVPAGIQLSIKDGNTTINSTTEAGFEAGKYYNITVDYEYVDLGLPSGTLWAKYNLGATTETDYGDFYAWGDLVPKSNYADTNLRTLNGSITNGQNLDLSDDAAHYTWGGDWRMPTKTEFEELVNNTTKTWTTINGKYGRKFTKNGKYVFLPAAGYQHGTTISDRSGGKYDTGSYWTSTCSDIDARAAWRPYFNSNGIEFNPISRSSGQSIRAVKSKIIM